MFEFENFYLSNDKDQGSWDHQGSDICMNPMADLGFEKKTNCFFFVT